MWRVRLARDVDRVHGVAGCRLGLDLTEPGLGQEAAGELLAERGPDSHPVVGERDRAFLDALLTYWGTVSDLVQRQEHGAKKEGEPLMWEDARRVVFQTAIVDNDGQRP